MDLPPDFNKEHNRKSEDTVSSSQSQEALDSSSASSLSMFADHSDGGQNSYRHSNRTSERERKSGEFSPSAPMNEALKSEKAFIEFVMSLPPKEVSETDPRSTPSVTVPKNKNPATGSNTTKVGLDHLDNLCKLMEQLSELRETNNKLQRRVQYLEDLKTLHDMHKEIKDESQYSSEDALNSSKQGYRLQKSATESCCTKTEGAQTLHPYRTHSKYLSRRGRSQIVDGQRRERSKSVGHDDSTEDTKSKRIFPKWSKVKEAFGWESDRKDSVKAKREGESGNPRRRSDDIHDSFRQMNSPTWSQDFPSLHSSLEDISEILNTDRWKRISVASEKQVQHNLGTPKEALKRQKSTPSPGSEKLMSFKDAMDFKVKSSTIERDSYSHLDYKEDGKRGKSPWGRVKTIIERRRDSLKRRSLRREHACSEYEPLASKKDITLEVSNEDSARHKPVGPEPLTIDQEVDYGGQRTPSSSPTFHRKSRWTRVKKVLKGKKEDEKEPSSTPASPNSVQDGHFTFDAIEEISQSSFEDNREIKRIESDSHVHQMVLSEPTCDLMLQLQRNLSEDFHRKIQEWERIRSSGTTSCSPHWERKASMPSRNRKRSERDDKNMKPKLKDLTWLEKELQKIEKEKQRLSKERKKYEERALRLEKLKETVLNAENSNKREVFVRTSAGEFRFEGISDAFTKKLYEWETKRGVRPELSTIALLDSSHLTVHPSMGPKSGPLQRVLSRSESSIADIGQHSHNSSNSLPSLKIPDTDANTTEHPSRANSEPDLSTCVNLANENSAGVSNLTRQAGGSSDYETTSPGVSRESEEDELDKKRNDSETYYGLLEENVILLEQLKGKEEICRRLETELQVLDKKVDVMNKHHTQETELYREKLWEMHKPGATPRDVQCCLRTMAQLRKRIEVLEKCTVKLRNDRESVEDRFRYHSKQQEDMTLDLLQKMGELQAAGSSAESESKEYIPQRVNASAMERLQDLSALLVKQTHDLQETLSIKSRQICQLRWELLHRDLSTVKLETELHSHTAHRKRSKYAHLRSHSSEDAPPIKFQQDFDCGKSAATTEAYFSVLTPENEFQATELTNTVQKLNEELLKLANAAAEYGDTDTTSHSLKKNYEESLSKTDMQSRNKENAKQITVRRISADNISMVCGKEEAWTQNVSSSLDSDSSDDGYTKISFHPYARGNYSMERLLMSSGEHPPRSYLQRRKKIQKLAKSNLSPSRKRSNTFHNKKDFEKPIILEKMPQKCHSFRYPAEKNYNHASKMDTLNIQNLLDKAKYDKILHRKAEMCRNSLGKILAPSCQLNPDITTDNQWLREVASDSKIPFLIQLQYQADLSTDRSGGNHPVRSMSEKRKKKSAERDIYTQKRNKRQLTAPDLFEKFNEDRDVKLFSKNYSKELQNIGYSKEQLNLTDCVSEHANNDASEPQTENLTNVSINNAITVTVQLPKKKCRKGSLKESEKDNGEQLVTIAMPKKQSLNSEQEFEQSLTDSFKKRQAEKYKPLANGDNIENENLSHTDMHNKISNCDVSENYTSDTRNQFSEYCDLNCEILNEPSANEITVKHHTAESSPLLKIENTSLKVREPMALNLHTNNPDDMKNMHTYFSNSYNTSYIKSPSASHLESMKVHEKVPKEGATNVKLLIEKYNKVSENQFPQSTNSSNINSPALYRKISSSLFNSKSDHAVPSHSFSTPTTPSIMSAATFYNPLVFRPTNLDLFPKSPPPSPMSIARNDALKRAKEQFIASQVTLNINRPLNWKSLSLPKQSLSENHVPHFLNTEESEKTDQTRPEEDKISNSSMDSMSYVMFRTAESCQESRLSKRSVDHSKSTSNPLDKNKLQTSKSLSNSSLFKSVLSSDFKLPTNFMKLKRSKRKKDMAAVNHLCRQSLLLTPEDSGKISTQLHHKSCPSSPELKVKTEPKSSWFQRNILRQK